MRKLYALFFVFVQFLILNAQTITGKLVDQTGIGLSGMSLKLYIFPKIYEATSRNDGQFVFNYVTEVKEDELPTGYAISENYPNPFNPKTRIEIAMPNSGLVGVTVYNILGQKVINPIEKYFGSGTSFIDLELNGLSNGFYIAHITINNKYSVNRKLMLLYGSQHLASSNFSSNNSLHKAALSPNSCLAVNIDSIVVTGNSIKKYTFTNLPQYSGSNLNLGNLTINIPSTGTPCHGFPTVVDVRDGKIYNTVQIGSQCWLKENLNVGTMIQGSQNQTNNGIVEKYCYNDDPDNCVGYGGLYQWDEAMTYTLTPGTKGICPDGYHIPALTELKILAQTVDSSSNALMAVGQGGSGNWYGTNTSGFSALLAGRRYYNGSFDLLGSEGRFWGSTESFTNWRDFMDLMLEQLNIEFVMTGSNDYGSSIRCIKD
jgi:uncharacterized protein (TIGR02145 family)